MKTRPGALATTTFALAVLSLAAPSLAADSPDEDQRAPLGRPGQPMLVLSPSAESAGDATRSASRTAPLPDVLLRKGESEHRSVDHGEALGGSERAARARR